MQIFYNVLYFYLFSCGSSFIAFVGVAAFLLIRYRRISIKSFLILAGIVILVFVIAALLFGRVGYELQMAIIEPYVQQALDQTCGPGVFQANEGHFGTTSAYNYWRADASPAECYYSNKGWVCSCS